MTFIATNTLANNCEEQKDTTTPYIHSTSLLMYVKDQGFVVCTEKRKRSGKKRGTRVVPHFVGGRVEAGETPLLAACREFCEEVPLNLEAALLEKAVASAHYEFFDICVSSQANLNHRFYLVNVESMDSEFESIKELIRGLVANFEPRPSALESLFYWDAASRLDNNDFSLTSLFLKSADKEKIQSCIDGQATAEAKAEVKAEPEPKKWWFVRMFGY